MIYFKYALPADTDLTDVPDNLGMVQLGHPVITEATEDTEAIYDTDTILVDVLWHDTEPTEWTPYRVKPTTHKHWFFGQQAVWEASNAE